MTSIPQNNLKERLLKLGYNPDNFTITPPVLDNSKVVKVERKPQASVSRPPQQPPLQTIAPQTNFKPPVILNINDWSDFEDD